MFSRGTAQPKMDFSLIAPDMVVTGDIVCTGTLHVEGRVNGNVRCGTLRQGPSGAVHGDIIADDASLAGLVDGAVEAGALFLEPSARVTGDVLYESVGIAKGAEVEGRFRRRRGSDDHGASAARHEAALPSPTPAILPVPAASKVPAAAPERAERAPRRAAPARAKTPELFAVQADEPDQAEAAE